MRKLTAFFLVFCFAFPASAFQFGGGGQFTGGGAGGHFKQDRMRRVPLAAGAGGGGATLRQTPVSEYTTDGVLATTGAVTAGDLLIVPFSTDAPADCTTWSPPISSSPSNTWTLIKACSESKGVALGLYYAQNAASGTTTVTITGIGADPGMAVYDWNVNGITSPFDVSSSKIDGTSTSTPTTNSFTTSQAHDLIFTAFGDELTGQASLSPGSGFTIGLTQAGHVDAQEYILDGSSGSQTSSIGLDTAASSTWVMATAAFKTQ